VKPRPIYRFAICRRTELGEAVFINVFDDKPNCNSFGDQWVRSNLAFPVERLHPRNPRPAGSMVTRCVREIEGCGGT
jgi:hypothetical protein